MKRAFNFESLQVSLVEQLKSSNVENAQEHIQGLIDCITELSNERNSLKTELEETTIEVGVLRSKHKSFQLHNANELANATSSAKQQNLDFVAELHKATDDIHEEVRVVDEQYQRLKRENETLLIKADEAKRIWPQLCGMMCVAMKKKAQLQIEVNETRCKTIETHQRAAALTEEANDFIQDIENYWRQFSIEANKVKEEADKWKNRIYEQDKSTSLAKSELDSIQIEIRWSQARNKKAAESVEREEAKYKGLKQQSSALQRKVASKLRLQEQLRNQIKAIHMDMQRQQSDYEKHIRNVAALNEETLSDAREAHRNKEIISIEKQSLKEKAEKSRFLLQNAHNRSRRARNALTETNNLANMVMSDLATARSEKMKLKERLVVVAGNREQMERRYEKELQKLTEDLQIQVMLKKEAKQAWIDSLGMLERWNETMLRFFERSDSAIDENRRRYVAYKGEIDLLRAEIEGLKIQEAGLALRFSEQTKIMRKMKKELTYILGVLQDSINENQVVVAQLIEAKGELEPKYNNVLKKFKETSKIYQATRDKLVQKNRTIKDLQDGIVTCKLQIEDLTDPREATKTKLAQVNGAILEHIQMGKEDLNCIGGKIYERLKLNQLLQRNSANFASHSKKLQRLVRHDISDILSMRQWLDFYEVVREDLRHELKDLVMEEVQMTKVADIRDSAIRYKLECLKRNLGKRSDKLKGTWVRIKDLLETFSHVDALGGKRKQNRLQLIEVEQPNGDQNTK